MEFTTFQTAVMGGGGGIAFGWIHFRYLYKQIQDKDKVLESKDVIIENLREDSKNYSERMLELSTSTRIFLEMNEKTISEFNNSRKQCDLFASTKSDDV